MNIKKQPLSPVQATITLLPILQSCKQAEPHTPMGTAPSPSTAEPFCLDELQPRNLESKETLPRLSSLHQVFCPFTRNVMDTCRVVLNNIFMKKSSIISLLEKNCYMTMIIIFLEKSPER